MTLYIFSYSNGFFTHACYQTHHNKEVGRHKQHIKMLSKSETWTLPELSDLGLKPLLTTDNPLKQNRASPKLPENPQNKQRSIWDLMTPRVLTILASFFSFFAESVENYFVLNDGWCRCFGSASDHADVSSLRRWPRFYGCRMSKPNQITHGDGGCPSLFVRFKTFHGHTLSS